MRLAEMPASSRMWVPPQETSAALPSEPLARVEKLANLGADIRTVTVPGEEDQAQVG